MTEVMVAGGILSLVLLSAGGAYRFFNKETKKEFQKMDKISEFNQLTRDLMKFTEGAGISTAYLNFPVRIRGCTFDSAGFPKEPCVAKVVDGKLVAPSESDFPDQWKGAACTQFFKDGRGSLVQRRAYPGKARNDLLNIIEDKQVKSNPSVELVAAWPMIDENSAPFLMLKQKDNAQYFTMLKGPPSEISKITDLAVNGGEGKQYSFFEVKVDDANSAVETENINKVISSSLNVPFLIYNAFFTNHYTIQYVADIKSCRDNYSFCQKELKDISRTTGSDFSRTGLSNDAALSLDLATNYPKNVFAVKFKAIELHEGSNVTDPYFRPIFKDPATGVQRLPSDCLSAWDINKQGVAEYFFPSKSYSISSTDAVSSDITGSDPLNILYLSHYYTSVGLAGISSATAKGVMVAVPIDIITYRVLLKGNANTSTAVRNLIARRWYPPGTTPLKDALRIQHLQNPFVVTRRIGTPEMGIWYNPVKQDASSSGGTP